MLPHEGSTDEAPLPDYSAIAPKLHTLQLNLRPSRNTERYTAPSLRNTSAVTSDIIPNSHSTTPQERNNASLSCNIADNRRTSSAKPRITQSVNNYGPSEIIKIVDMPEWTQSAAIRIESEATRRNSRKHNIKVYCNVYKEVTGPNTWRYREFISESLLHQQEAGNPFQRNFARITF